MSVYKYSFKRRKGQLWVYVKLPQEMWLVVKVFRIRQRKTSKSSPSSKSSRNKHLAFCRSVGQAKKASGKKWEEGEWGEESCSICHLLKAWSVYLFLQSAIFLKQFSIYIKINKKFWGFQNHISLNKIAPFPETKRNNRDNFKLQRLVHKFLSIFRKSLFTSFHYLVHYMNHFVCFLPCYLTIPLPL